MYQPVPLNWIAGEESSFTTGPPPHDGQTADGVVREALDHLEPVSAGLATVLVQRHAVFSSPDQSSRSPADVAEHQLPVGPEGRRPLPEQRVVEGLSESPRPAAP